VDVERCVGRTHRVGSFENLLKLRRVGEATVRHGVKMREVEDGADPARASGDREDVVRSAELAHAAHDLHAEGNRTVLLLQPLAQFAQLFDHGVDRRVALAAEEEAGMEHDDFRAGRLCDARRMVEHPYSHVELLAALGVAHEACDRCVDGEDDARVARELAELLGPRIVHPELPFEVDLAGRVAALLEQFDGLFRALTRGHTSGAIVKLRHVQAGVNR